MTTRHLPNVADVAHASLIWQVLPLAIDDNEMSSLLSGERRIAAAVRAMVQVRIPNRVFAFTAVPACAAGARFRRILAFCWCSLLSSLL